MLVDQTQGPGENQAYGNGIIFFIFIIPLSVAGTVCR